MDQEEHLSKIDESLHAIETQLAACGERCATCRRRVDSLESACYGNNGSPGLRMLTNANTTKLEFMEKSLSQHEQQHKDEAAQRRWQLGIIIAGVAGAASAGSFLATLLSKVFGG